MSTNSLSDKRLPASPCPASHANSTLLPLVVPSPPVTMLMTNTAETAAGENDVTIGCTLPDPDRRPTRQALGRQCRPRAAAHPERPTARHVHDPFGGPLRRHGQDSAGDGPEGRKRGLGDR